MMLIWLAGRHEFPTRRTPVEEAYKSIVRVLVGARDRIAHKRSGRCGHRTQGSPVAHREVDAT